MECLGNSGCHDLHDRGEYLKYCKMKKLLHHPLLFIILTTFLLMSCGGHEESNPVDHSIIERNSPIAIPELALQEFTYEDLARYTISYLMGQQPKIIQSKKEKDYYRVSYKRPSDAKLFEYRIKFEGSVIFWASYDGRWRSDPADEKITFVENGKRIKIIQTFSDGSTDNKEFEQGE